MPDQIPVPPWPSSRDTGVGDVATPPEPCTGLYDRQGRPITANDWGRLWRDVEGYRVVARTPVIPTQMAVLTVWEGVPDPGTMFATAVYRLDRDPPGDFLTVAETDTEDHARIAHAMAVDAVLLDVPLRQHCLRFDAVRRINPGTPGTVCRCPGPPNTYGHAGEPHRRWIVASSCLVHAHPLPACDEHDYHDNHGDQ